jgi:2-haloacid dehalogenase
MDRRTFVTTASAGAASVALKNISAVRRARPIKAVAFDGFALFDATAVVPVAESMVTGRGRELVLAWRARHFEYQWLRTLGGQYADFERTADDALAVVASSLGVTLSRADRQRLVEAQSTLRPWPDTVAAIRALREAGLRLCMLSNMTEAMLAGGLRRAGLATDFEVILSTDRVRAAKPAAQAYDMARSVLALEKDQIAFVAFAGWDAAGASWFGYPTAWLNKNAAPAEELGAPPQITATDLATITRWIVGASQNKQ